MFACRIFFFLSQHGRCYIISHDIDSDEKECSNLQEVHDFFNTVMCKWYKD